MGHFYHWWSVVTAFSWASAPFTSAAPLTKGPVTWVDCPSSISTKLKCADITVPLDHNQTNGETIQLTITKLPTNNTKGRVGTVVWQFGGPGDETTPALKNTAEGTQDSLGDIVNYFDVVTAEPRGVAFNHPVQCDPKFSTMRQPYYPTTKESWENATSFFGDWGQSCLERTGKVMHYMDTITQAKDLEYVRLAIGEGKLNYYGLSWGTIRGHKYAQLYPKNIRAMVLDGVVDHTINQIQLASTQAYSYSISLRRMLDWMGSNATSPLFGRDVVQLFRNLVARANLNPIPAPSCADSGLCFPNITGDDIRSLTFGGVNTPSSVYPPTAQAFKEAYDYNNASLLSEFFVPQPGNPLMSTTLAIICNDWDFKETWTQYMQKQWMAAAASLDPQGPSPFRVWGLGCQKWPTRVVDPAEPFYIKDPSASILIVNALWDPVTGFDQALDMHSRIENSVLVARYGEGHGSLEFAPTVDIIYEYLRTAQVPDENHLLVGTPLDTLETDFEMMGWNHGER